MKKIVVIILMLLSSVSYALKSQKVCVIGTGYVGLVTGACLADIGHQVVCADIDIDKIESLKKQHVPFYEPGLQDLVRKNTDSGHLSFTHEVKNAIKNGDIVFVTVGTPMGEGGDADLSALRSVVRTISECLNKPKTIVIKSTVPLGTCKTVKKLFTTRYRVRSDRFDIVSNPEFLREGSAVSDFMHPDRIVIGVDSEQARQRMRDLYYPLVDDGAILVETNLPTAEIIKYASNTFLSIKLSFINEMANLCDAVEADAHVLAKTLGQDKRISPLFLNPGPGFGGSCFPKDVNALITAARKHNIALHTAQASLITNETQKHKPVEKLCDIMQNDLMDKTVAILGLSFKANTDDVRYSPTIPTIYSLLNMGVTIKAYDPEAMENMKKVCPNLVYCSSALEAVTGADALIIMTEWDEFKYIDLEQVKSVMKQPVIIDGRNILDLDQLNELGFAWDNIGQAYRRKR